MSQAGQFKGKVAIVTGSSSGIGKAIAVKLAERGASVVVCGRDGQRTQAVRHRCVSASGGKADRFSTFCGDLNDKANRARLLSETLEKFSRLDILIPNSGIMTTFTVEEETEETFDLVMDSNLKSVVFLVQAALPHLEKTEGTIVCVSSGLSTRTMPNRVTYQLSKAALDHFVHTLAVSQGPKGIRVNSVNPGVVGTRLYRDVENHDEEARVKVMGRLTPLHGRVSTPEEQADVALFLAGDQARFLSGQCVNVDGAANRR